MLEIAKNMFNCEDGRLYLLIGDGDLVICTDGEVNPESKLWFRPLYYSLTCSYSTISHTKSLRLIAKRISKLNEFKGHNGIDGFSHRVDGLTVKVTVRSPHQLVLEQFLVIRLEISLIRLFEIVRERNYGVLHQHFEVNKTDIKRDDGIESFDNEDEENSSHHHSMYA